MSEQPPDRPASDALSPPSDRVPPPAPEAIPSPEVAPSRERVRRPRKEPVFTLNGALIVYVAVNALFGLPLLLFPSQFYDLVGINPLVAQEFGEFRWVGAMLIAWAFSALLVLARPGGRAIFVTTGAVQLSFGAAALAYGFAVRDLSDDALAYHVVATLVLLGGALYMWWARFRARTVLSAQPETPPRLSRRERRAARKAKDEEPE